MSIPVELTKLAEAMERFRFAYLLTSSQDDAAPHAVAVAPVLVDGALVLAGLGRRSQANAQARPKVSLIWPPLAASEYSLIIDGIASTDGAAMQIRPTRAVLHRPLAPEAAPAAGHGAAGACGADCVEILAATPAPGR